ncbi:hypothetical protein PLICRDRAFT_37602 [Plicaturopsis crispa FD-325 SS-3]|nr:hypothetical protein PLICRDRAFT_37602 [Plicaturopsis crispa FD-325 SS-3]
MSIYLFLACALAVVLLLVDTVAAQWIQYAPNGTATMTHYTIPLDFVASCGCTPASTHYATAAMSQYAFGSSTSYGPGCGRCFNLTLLNTFLSDPPFYPTVTKSVVVKVTDLCPFLENGWCGATTEKTNPGGAYINFDLAFPSPAIPDDFFPSNATLYGYTDFGVWNVSYESVDCNPDWPGSKEAAAVGSEAILGTSACCPADPFSNTSQICPSFSDQNGIPPDTTTSFAYPHSIPSTAALILTFITCYWSWMLY